VAGGEVVREAATGLTSNTTGNSSIDAAQISTGPSTPETPKKSAFRNDRLSPFLAMAEKMQMNISQSDEDNKVKQARLDAEEARSYSSER